MTDFRNGLIPNGSYNNQSAFDFSIPNVLHRKPKFQINDHVWIKDFLMPTENIIIGIKEVDNIIVYNLKSSKTGFEQDVYEKDCFPTRQEAKEYNKPNYNELEKSHILLIEELDKAKKQIGDMNNYIKSLQEIINSLQKKE